MTQPRAASGAPATQAPGVPSIEVTVAELRHRIGDLRAAQCALTRRPRAEILARLADVVEAWLAPHSPWLAHAVAVLPAATGFSAEMIGYALPTMIEPLRAPALGALVDAEVGRREGPRLILHILAGNLPGLAAIPAALSLAIGSAALLKAGRGDCVFPSLFTASIAARDAELAGAIAACHWPAGDQAFEAVAVRAADLVVASGDDATIADLAARVPGRFIGHGHRISFAIVGREVADDEAAARAAAAHLAEDVAIWDQRGCLSPQLCFVEGERDHAARFGAAVAEALRPLATRLPPASMSTAERLAVRRLRDEAEWRSFGGEPLRIIAVGAEGDGTVVVEPAARFVPSPLGRSLRVMPIDGIAALGPLLQPARPLLEGVGLAAAPPRFAALAAQLGTWGVHRVCAVGRMQRPGLDWRQGGRPRVAEWVA